MTFVPFANLAQQITKLPRKTGDVKDVKVVLCTCKGCTLLLLNHYDLLELKFLRENKLVPTGKGHFLSIQAL